ncbi:MAG: hypothetical protein K2H12_09360, partial [Acetatifactor sp.]|nr:hypothetical protein [Acetatifactor sp.]
LTPKLPAPNAPPPPLRLGANTPPPPPLPCSNGRIGRCGTLKQHLPGQCPEKVLAALWTGLSLLVMVLGGRMRNSK